MPKIEFPDWLRTWPGPRANAAAATQWLESTPLGRQIEGPNREWAVNKGDYTQALWVLDRVENASLRIQCSEHPDGYWTTAQLYERWREDWCFVRPSIPTFDLWQLLTK